MQFCLSCEGDIKVILEKQAYRSRVSENTEYINPTSPFRFHSTQFCVVAKESREDEIQGCAVGHWKVWDFCGAVWFHELASFSEYSDRYWS